MVPADKSYWYAGNYRNGKMIHARLSPGEENSGKLVNVVREQAKKQHRKQVGKRLLLTDLREQAVR